MDFWDVLRLLNIMLSVIAQVGLTMAVVFRWEEFTPRLRRITPWLISVFAVWCYGIGEQLANETEPGLRVPLATLVLLGLDSSLFYHFREGK